MRKSTNKSLGQLAYEAGHPAKAHWQSWAELGPRSQEQHERMARAVTEECACEAEDAINNGVVSLSAAEVANFIRSRALTGADDRG